MDSTSKRLAIIVPSFNDVRIVHTLLSIRRQDSGDLTRIYVIDGGSRPDALALIRPHLRSQDVLVSERDRGIYDGLNKGLDIVRETYMTWLGSDDAISRNVDFVEILESFEREQLDCIIFETVFIDQFGCLRKNLAVSPTLRNYRFGRHISHFSSYWRMSTIGSLRFRLDFPLASDQDFFLKIIKSRPLKYKTVAKVGTIARVGGTSTRGVRGTLRANTMAYDIFRLHFGTILGLIAVIGKLTTKLFVKFSAPRYPVMEEFTDLLVRSNPKGNEKPPVD
jgi:glycosyltransferase involved in cell wall biosynthesis